MKSSDKFELRRLRERDGVRGGTVIWWSIHDGRQLANELEHKYQGRGEDIFQEIVQLFLKSSADSVVDAIESGDPARITSLARKIAFQSQSESHKGTSMQTHFERETLLVDFTEEGGVHTHLADPTSTELAPATFDNDVFEILRDLKNPKAAQAMWLVSQEDFTYAEVADALGYKSKQAVQQICTSPSTLRNFAMNWRARKHEDLCQEVAGPLALVAWNVPDLKEEERTLVEQHVANCPSCAHLLETHEKTMRIAIAFFPLPAAMLVPSGSVLDPVANTWHSLTSRASDFVASLSTNPTAHNIKPFAAIGLAAAALTGTGVAVQQSIDKEKPRTPLVERSFTPPTIPKTASASRTTAKREASKRRKKAEEAAAPATKTSPTQSPSPNSSSSPAPVDDGSSEFLPEAR